LDRACQSHHITVATPSELNVMVPLASSRGWSCATDPSRRGRSNSVNAMSIGVRPRMTARNRGPSPIGSGVSSSHDVISVFRDGSLRVGDADLTRSLRVAGSAARR
jgi:hypothetical protein